MAVAAAPGVESAADSLAATQGFMGLGSLGQISQIGLAGLSSGTAGLLASQGLAGNALATLGLAGPLVSPTPQGIAYNVQAANVVVQLIGQLAGLGAAQAYLALGTGASLANSGRRFLLSTYYGVW